MGAVHIRETKVYKLGFDLAMRIYEISKLFPKEERYSLTDQIRRSSRSVCVCLAESWRKKQYEAYFVSKVSDSDMENTETQTWLEFALACGYIDEDLKNSLMMQSDELGRLLHHMMNNPEKYR
jgi:four helix bundle protein